MSWRRRQAYGQNLRDQVLAVPGLLREVAERFNVSQAYVSRARAPRSRPRRAVQIWSLIDSFSPDECERYIRQYWVLPVKMNSL